MRRLSLGFVVTVSVFTFGIALAMPSHANNCTTLYVQEQPTANAGKIIVHTTRLMPSVQKSCFPIGTNAGGTIAFALIGWALHRANEDKEPWSHAGVVSKSFGLAAVNFASKTWDSMTDCLNQVIFNPSSDNVVVEKAH